MTDLGQLVDEMIAWAEADRRAPYLELVVQALSCDASRLVELLEELSGIGRFSDWDVTLLPTGVAPTVADLAQACRATDNVGADFVADKSVLMFNFTHADPDPFNVWCYSRYSCDYWSEKTESVRRGYVEDLARVAVSCARVAAPKVILFGEDDEPDPDAGPEEWSRDHLILRIR